MAAEPPRLALGRRSWLGVFVRLLFGGLPLASGLHDAAALLRGAPRILTVDAWGAALFIAAGLLLMTLDGGAELVRDEGSLERWAGLRFWGFGRVALWRRRRALPEGAPVSYREASAVDDEGRPEVSYPVAVGDVEVARGAGISEARRLATAVARFLGRPLADAGGLIAPEDLGAALRTRYLLGGRFAPAPAPPDRCRFSPTASEAGLMVELPRGAWRLWLWAAVPLGLFLAFVYALMGPLVLLPLAVFGPVVFGSLLYQLGRRDRVLVTPEWLVLERSLFGLLPLGGRIPRAAVESLDIAEGTGLFRSNCGTAGPCVTATGGGTALEFGFGLSGPELAYLRALLLRELAD